MSEKTDRNIRPKASIEQRVAATKEALIDAGGITEADLDQFAHMAQDWRPENGAKVVARAWTDPDFRARLLEDATSACAEMGYAGPQGEYIVALENTRERHNVIVCTQCSCTAWPVLGLPPDWYKSPAYRARVVREPRRVLSEMGLQLSNEVAIRVWETSAETRYMVIPLRPEGTQTLTEDALARVVTREALIGVALANPPVREIERD
ncbi:MAG: nitrile hydratase subunit alpha, partial [Pseudomonadota bacterium]|nr:nitrile hydratase subunit alpha [Pseudomonadota bacterium]